MRVFFTETVPKIFQSLVDWVKTNWQAILLFLINPFAGLFKYFYDNNTKFKEFVDKSGIPTTNFIMGNNLVNKDCKNCNVSDIYFPDSLREIGNEAFKNFKNILHFIDEKSIKIVFSYDIMLLKLLLC